MIDIHTHILPNLDDGSESWEETLNIIRAGIEDGIKGAVCTSHVFKVLSKDLETRYTQRFNELKKRVKQENIHFKLWLGSEINVNAKFDLKSKIATFNDNKKYVLLELPMSDYPHHVDDLLFKLSLQNLTPVLAHPERNTVIMQKPEIVESLIQRNVLIQINSGSLTGMFGGRVRKISMGLLKKGLVHVIASDCHSYKNRPMQLGRAYEIVKKMCGKKRADFLFTVNPGKIISGDAIYPEDTQGEIADRGWKVWVNNLVKRIKKSG